MRKTLISLITILIALTISACGPTPWEKAQQADTIEALEAFVAANPTSEFADIANTRMGELIWTTAIANNTRDGYEQYLMRYDSGPHADEARLRVVDIRWQSAVAANTIGDYREFIRSGAPGSKIESARDAVKLLQSDASAERPEVEISGIFSGGTIKYVQHISTRYDGEIAGFPAEVSYAVSAGEDENGKQQYFLYQQGDEVLSLVGYPSVVGTIELQMPGDRVITYELYGLVMGSNSDLVGSYLVAKGPGDLWSSAEGLLLAKTAHDSTPVVLSAGEVVLFAVHENFRLLYVP